MQCRTCGAPLPSGAAFCTNCGAATPYNLSGQVTPGAQPAAPSQVQPNNQPPSSYNPAQVPPQPGQAGIAPTVYGRPSYGAPTEKDYTPPPPPPPNLYGAPYAPTPGSFIPPGQPSRRQGPKVGLIIGIVAIVLLLVAGGIIAIFATRNNPNSPTSTAAGVSPSGSPVDPTSATIISNAQTASAVDSNSLPTNATSNFSVRQTVYVTFHLNTNGQAGYVQAKLYSDTTYVGDKMLMVQSSYDHGYFSLELNTAATGIVELYWCAQSNCSDAKLATVVTFHVS
jgi:zinc-ribbon domain